MNNTYIIREAVPDDAEKMISYLNQAGGESYQIHAPDPVRIYRGGNARRRDRMADIHEYRITAL